MVQFLFFIIFAAIAAAVLILKFKSVPAAKKGAIGGGGLAAAAIALIVQSVLSWYMALLVLVAVSLGAAMIYMKMLEKEKLENQRLAEERKERRQSLISPDATTQPVLNKIQSTPKAEKISVQQEPAAEKVKETIEEPQPERETVPPSFGMQSIQPMGKEHSREQ